MAISPVLGHPPISSLPAKRAQQPTIINRNRSPDTLQSAVQSLDDHSMKTKSREDRQSLYTSLISHCISSNSLDHGRRLRSHLARTGFQPGLFLDNQFINLYTRCGDVATAREIFDAMNERNVVSWNAMIAGYCSNHRFTDALRLFQSMLETGPAANQPTYLITLRASARLKNPKHGQQIHAHLIKQGHLSSTHLGNAVISMYSKLGRQQEAETVFKNMVEHDGVSWNSVIAANTKKIGHGHRALTLFVEMQNAGLMPDEFTFGSLLASKEVAIVEELHSQIIRRALTGNVFIGSALLDAYARSGRLEDTLLVFKAMPEKNNVAWNSVISVCFDGCAVDEGLRLFLQMGEDGMIPDEYTVSILLKAAKSQLSAAAGKQFHGLAVKMGSQTETLMGNSLIAMYGEHNAVSDSWRAFEDIAETDLITWNSMLQSYIKNERLERALSLFAEMKCSEFQSDEFSFVSALAACTSLSWLQTGRGVHGDLIKNGLTQNTFIGSALVDMYAKCMIVADAKKVFDEIGCKDLIIWNSLISGMAQNGDLDQVMKLICQMREENLQPDNFTFASSLAASANAAAIQQGRQLHALIFKSELNPDTAVANALITMYTRVGGIKEAEKAFSKLEHKNVVSWTTMIGGYAQSGYPRKALELLDEMEKSGLAPNEKTFIALLTACSYAGLIEEGAKYFAMMETIYGIKPGFNHYACMVDILGRAGRLQEAEDFIMRMPYKPDALVWRMLLSACRFHGDLDRGRRAMEKILSTEPSDSASYVLLSNLHASLENWDSVVEVRQMMRENRVKKEPGKSQIEVHSGVHEFLAGDHSHPQAYEIYSRLAELFKQMKGEEHDLSMECLKEISG